MPAKKTKKSASNKKIKLLVALSALLVLMTAGAYALHRHNSTPAGTKQTTTTTSKARGVNNVDYGAPTKTDTSISNGTKDSTKAGSSDTTQSTTAISVIITRAGNQANDDGTTSVIVGTEVDGTTTGTCTLTASQSGQSDITVTNTVAFQGTSYACPNFSIPYSEFPTGGTWNFKVLLKDGNQSAESTQLSEVTVNK